MNLTQRVARSSPTELVRVPETYRSSGELLVEAAEDDSGSSTLLNRPIWTVDRNGQSVGPSSCRPAPSPSDPGGPPKEAALNQERFVNLLEGGPVLTHGGGEGVEPHRSPGELLDEAAEDGAVAGFEADGVDLELIERTPSPFEADHLLAGDIGEVADAAQQPFRHPHGPARPAADLEAALASRSKPRISASRVTPSANSSSV